MLTQKAEADLYEFEANLVYKANFKTARTVTKRIPVSKTKTKKKTKQNKNKNHHQNKPNKQTKLLTTSTLKEIAILQ